MNRPLPSALTIRAVTEADYAAWLPLWLGYNAFYGRSGPTALADDITATTWSRFLDADEPVHALVAESGSEIVGLVHYIFHCSTTRVGPVCYLQDLFTTEASRGLGVGRALIEAVYGKAREAGATRVYWQTHETNTTAQQLYNNVAEHTGFVVYAKPV